MYIIPHLITHHNISTYYIPRFSSALAINGTGVSLELPKTEFSSYQPFGNESLILVLPLPPMLPYLFPELEFSSELLICCPFIEISTIFLPILFGFD